MSHLRTLPRTDDVHSPQAITLVSAETREVVYLEEAASIEIITEALKAWGLRVRAEREEKQDLPVPEVQAEGNWQTTRPEQRAPGRLANVLSPLWLPVQAAEVCNEPVSMWSWFTRAA